MKAKAGLLALLIWQSSFSPEKLGYRPENTVQFAKLLNFQDFHRPLPRVCTTPDRTNKPAIAKKTHAGLMTL